MLDLVPDLKTLLSFAHQESGERKNEVEGWISQRLLKNKIKLIFFKIYFKNKDFHGNKINFSAVTL